MAWELAIPDPAAEARQSEQIFRQAASVLVQPLNSPSQ